MEVTCPGFDSTRSGRTVETAGEDAIELGFQIGFALRSGRAPVGLEIAVELPDGGARGLLNSCFLLSKKNISIDTLKPLRQVERCRIRNMQSQRQTIVRLLRPYICSDVDTYRREQELIF
jgi:hypothetical protein